MTIRGEEVMELISEDGMYRVAWINLGEGICEDYDPDDPGDENLLRFDVYVRDQDAPADEEGWLDPDDASYCTNMPADAPVWMLERGLEAILREFMDSYDVTTGHGHRKPMEWMSWIGPSDFKHPMYIGKKSDEENL